jgi:hypothetical protein
MMKDDRLSPTPVLVENLGSVLGFNVWHFNLLLLTIFSFQRRADTSQPRRKSIAFYASCKLPTAKQLRRAANRSRCVTGRVSCASFWR